MKIANKITLLIVSLLCILAASTWVSLRQMANIRGEFAAMAEYDTALMGHVAQVHQLQLQKNILLQKIIGVAEELGFEQVSFARSSYLHDQLKGIGEGLNRYAKDSAKETIQARSIAVQAHKGMIDDDQRLKLEKLLEGLKRLEEARTNYDASLAKMLSAVEAGGFQLSLEDLEQIQSQEDKLTKDVEKLLKYVQSFLSSSLAKASQWEAQAQHVLRTLLFFTVILGCLLAFWIVRSIISPLRELSMAAKKIGEGDFHVAVKAGSGDEMAELAAAFNAMSQKLEEFKARLEKKNSDLKTTNADLDQFIRIMGEEIVNPLTMMIGYCAYIEQHGGSSLDPKSLESVQGIRKAATKMHQMVKNLLDFTKSKRDMLK